MVHPLASFSFITGRHCAGITDKPTDIKDLFRNGHIAHVEAVRSSQSSTVYLSAHMSFNHLQRGKACVNCRRRKMVPHPLVFRCLPLAHRFMCCRNVTAFVLSVANAVTLIEPMTANIRLVTSVPGYRSWKKTSIVLKLVYTSSRTLNRLIQPPSYCIIHTCNRLGTEVHREAIFRSDEVRRHLLDAHCYTHHRD